MVASNSWSIEFNYFFKNKDSFGLFECRSLSYQIHVFLVGSNGNLALRVGNNFVFSMLNLHLIRKNRTPEFECLIHFGIHSDQANRVFH